MAKKRLSRVRGNARKGVKKRVVSKATSLKAKSRPNMKKRPRFSKITPAIKLPSPEQLQNGNGTIKALLTVRAELRALEVGYKRRVHSRVAVVYGIALFLRADESAWIKFTRHKEWKNAKKNRPQLEHRSNALQYALRFAIGLKGEDASKRASKYYRALVKLFDEEVPANAIPARIRKAGGFDALANQNAADENDEHGETPASPTSPPIKPEPAECDDDVLKESRERTPRKRRQPMCNKPMKFVDMHLPYTRNTIRLFEMKGKGELTMRFSVIGASESSHSVTTSDVQIVQMPKERDNDLDD